MAVVPCSCEAGQRFMINFSATMQSPVRLEGLREDLKLSATHPASTGYMLPPSILSAGLDLQATAPR